MSGVAVRNLTKTFGDLVVLDDISFAVEPGEFCILLGPSGCGKTTLLRIVAGLEREDRGEILVGERKVNRLTPKERDVSMVFQSYALYPHMSVFENMAFPLKARRCPKPEIRERVRRAASLLDIEELLSRKPRELSGGQRQRVAIGRAIVRNPRLFLFDEPLSNLDAKLRASMRVELAGLHRQLQATILYVTHDQVEAMTLGEKIVLLHEGRIQQIGSPRELYHRPANLFVATFVGSPTMNLLDGSLALEDGHAILRSSGLDIDLGAAEGLEKLEGRAMTLGIRPEALTPGDEGIRGRLELFEHLGSETTLYLRAGERRISAKAAGDWEGTRGEELRLRLDPAGVHFFVDGAAVRPPWRRWCDS